MRVWDLNTRNLSFLTQQCKMTIARKLERQSGYNRKYWTLQFKNTHTHQISIIPVLLRGNKNPHPYYKDSSYMRNYPQNNACLIWHLCLKEWAMTLHISCFQVPPLKIIPKINVLNSVVRCFTSAVRPRQSQGCKT